MNCIQCRTKPAKFREADEASRVYCSQECFYIGLKRDDNVVGLVSSDGVEFRVPKEIALKMKTIAYQIEDAGVDDWIPLPRVDSKQLHAILEALKREKPTQEEFLNQFEVAIYLEAEPVILESYREFANIIGNTTDLNLIRRFKDQVNRVFYFLEDASSFIQRCKLAGIDTNLLQKKFNVKKVHRLSIAVQEGLIEDVKFLSLMGFKANLDELTDLAIENAHFDIAKYLITEKQVKLTQEDMISRLLDGKIKETTFIGLIDYGFIDIKKIPIVDIIRTRRADVLKRIFDSVQIDDSSPEFKRAFELAAIQTPDTRIIEFLFRKKLFLNTDFISDLLERRRKYMRAEMIRVFESKTKRAKRV